MTITKHTLICIKGEHFGEVFEVELNNKPIEAFGGALYVKNGKLVFTKKYETEKKENKSIIKRILSIFEDKSDKPMQFCLGDRVLTELNDQFRSSRHNAYQLIRSDLYKPEYEGYTEFQGVKELYLAEPEKDAIESIKKQITPEHEKTISSISDTIEKYIAEYIKDPIAVIEKQNQLLRDDWNLLEIRDIEFSSGEGSNVLYNELRPITDAFESMTRLNALVEKELVNRKAKDESTVIELKSIEYLAEGDYSPTHGAKPGERINKIGKGNLRLNKTEDADFLKLLAEAKIDAARPETSKLAAALKVYRRIAGHFKGKYQMIGRAEMTAPLHNYLNKGSCIDQALILQLALQEAGIRSRFVRGKYMSGSDRHAWVEADALEPGKYALILDPARNTITSKFDRSTKEAYKYEANEGEKLDYFNVIWRTK